MGLVDVVALLIVFALVGLAIAYIVREKRRGVVCVGCANAKACAAARKAKGECSCPCCPTVRISE